MPAIFVHYDCEPSMSKYANSIYNEKSWHVSLWREYVTQLIVDGIITFVYTS